MVCRKLQKSNYEELIEMYKYSSAKWLDEEFQYEINDDIAGYRRVEEVLPKGAIPTFMDNPI
jgi:hypothetical protein